MPFYALSVILRKRQWGMKMIRIHINLIPAPKIMGQVKMIFPLLISFLFPNSTPDGSKFFKFGFL